jgi:hypothetical protein
MQCLGCGVDNKMLLMDVLRDDRQIGTHTVKTIMQPLGSTSAR